MKKGTQEGGRGEGGREGENNKFHQLWIFFTSPSSIIIIILILSGGDSGNNLACPLNSLYPNTMQGSQGYVVVNARILMCLLCLRVRG